MNMLCGKRPRFEVEFEMLQGVHYILLTLFYLGQIGAFLLLFVCLGMLDWKTSVNPFFLARFLPFSFLISHLPSISV